MKILTTAALILSLSTPVIAQSRDNIQIAGSSTVLPYANIVAEAFGENFDFPTPVVESGGSSTGLRRFCEGVGMNTTDIANSSRSIRENEIATCAENGVTEITEVRIGYDGIVFASDINGPSFAFEPVHIYLALNEQSTFTNWSEIDPTFPDQEIAMYIPGTRHGTREVFEEQVLLEGCIAVHGEPTDDVAEEACMAVRTDGVSVDIDGDYTETLSRINANPEGIGVFGLAFYENNTATLQVATMSGVTPSVETISTGEYPVSRPLFFYVKNAHLGIVPGLQEYIEFFVSDAIAGPFGPLAAYGLVSDPALTETQENVQSLR